MSVNKNDFIRHLHHKLNKISKEYYDDAYRYTYVETRIIVDAFIDLIAEIIEAGDILKLSGLMTIEPYYKKSRKYNIGGNRYSVEEHFIPKAKFHKNIKEACQTYGESVLQQKQDEEIETKEDQE